MLWLGIGLMVFAACLGGIFSRPAGVLSAFWPANGLLLGLVVRFPMRAKPSTWMAAGAAYMAADMLTGTAWQLALPLAAVNLLSVTSGWMVLRRLSQPVLDLRQNSSVMYLLLAALTASTVGAVAGSVANPWNTQMPWPDLLMRWLSAEFMNYMLIVPLILAAPRPSDPPSPSHGAPWLWRVAPVGALLMAEGIRWWVGGPGALAFAVPALLWCALSYTTFTTCVLTMMVCLWTMADVAAGIGSLSAAQTGDVVSLRIGVTLLALGPLAVSCASAARAETLRRLDYALRHDELTGVLARQAFLRQGELLLDRYQRQTSGVAVMVLAVDHFKPVSEQFGPSAGDRLLVAVSQALSRQLRAQDIMGRVGGDEFAVVLPEMSRTEARDMAEKLREVVQAHTYVAPSERSPQKATVSVGLAHSATMSGAADLDLMLMSADSALYRAKAAGRNCVAQG